MSTDLRNRMIHVALDLVTETCYSCGVLFAMPNDFQDQRIADHRNFYCPAGHDQAYCGPTEAEKQRKRAEQAEQRLAWAISREGAQRREKEAAERSARAYRGHLTRLRNRIANGICPVTECRRHFPNVKAHIATQHPEWAHDHPEALA